MSQQSLALTLAFAVGCVPDYPIEAGVHIDLEIEPGREPCGDLVGHMDRFLELVADVWNVDLDGRHYTYRWYTDEGFQDEAGCRDGTIGCASSSTVRATAAPMDHELVHLVSFAVGHPPPFFTEGAAVAFELPVWFTETGLPGPSPIADHLTVPVTSGRDYLLAGAYTRYLIDHFGMLAYLEFYASLDDDADRETIAAAHAAAFAEPLGDSIAIFDAERRDCELERFRFKLFECAAPPVAWTGDTLTLRRSISCADDDVVGPFLDDASARAYASFTVAKAGLFELSAASDERGWTTVKLGSCGGCESASPVTLHLGLGPQRVALEAGPHYFELNATADGDTQLSLQLRRID